MPSQANNPTKKKKKGRAPAHQNTFAFRHNPKSKTTDKILNSPIIGVCRRCHDKIEWRKKYRKYKPLTQPGKCNKCQKRNITSAYHTICRTCSMVEVEVTKSIHEGDGPAETTTTTTTKKRRKMCEICVKEPVTSKTMDEIEEEKRKLKENLTQELSSGGKLTLRDRKRIERKLEKMALGEEEAGEEEEETNNAEGHDDNNHDESSRDGSSSEHDMIDEMEEEDDPFLKAVGGKDKLLTGKAYQDMLLQSEST